MANFDKAFSDLILIEGGYSDHPSDNGGKTMYGITEVVARKHGFTGDMKSLTIEDAKRIYHEEFWKPFNFELIQNSKVAGELFEFTVNTGSGSVASKILQRSYNILNKNIQLREDGVIGATTAKTINTYKFYKSLFKTMNILQGMFYISLAEGDSALKSSVTNHKETAGSEQFKTFIRGWIDKRVSF